MKPLMFIIVVFFFCLKFSFQENNVCQSFDDYNQPNNNKNCYFEPDMLLETPAIIKKYAGSVQLHPVTTKDGYILTLFRIARKKPKGVILLHHSIATYSRIFLWQGDESLALRLWRNGFDVWLANHRGTSFSDGHVNMTSYDFSYWNFTFHEVGVYDVSSELQLIRKTTNETKVIFLGHSMGSSVGIIYSSIKSEEAKNYLKAMVLIGTPCYFDHLSSSILLIKPYAPLIVDFINFLRIGSPLILLHVLLPISRIVLRLFPPLLFLANLLILSICGNTPNETDPTFFNYDSLIFGNNFSWKTLIHYVQLTDSNHRFQMFDYTKKGNLEIYGEEIPPLYPIKNISVPTLLVSSSDDILTTQKDSDTLFDELSPEAKIHGHWKISGLNHLDFYTGLHRRKIFTNRLIKRLNELL